MLDLSRLSPAQRQAVLAPDGPLLIVAGPGSGKTLVLAARIAYLVTARQVSPASILALTFATKAARELRERLAGMLGPPGAAVDVATFHALGLRIIRQWSEELGLGPGPLVVYGETEARGVLEQAVDERGIDREGRPLSELAAELERFRLGTTSAGAPGWLPELAEAYEAMLTRRAAVDFPAMLALPLRLFAARPNALRLYQDSYRYVLCDEVQDICTVQYALLRQLAERHRNLVVVGDPRQCLYGWRGADIRFLREFQRDFPEANWASLDQNFRSNGRIVALANALGAALPENRPLWTDNPPGEPALLVVAQDEQAEAAFVVAEIERLLTARRIDHPGEVAVLYRTRWQATELVLAFRARRLPYRVHGHGDLFTRREVRDAIAYLRLARNPDDQQALTRVVNVPPRRLGRLVDDLRTHPAPIGDLPDLAARYGPAARASAEAFVAMIDELHRQSTRLSPASLLDLALDRSGYRSWLATQADGRDRLAHLANFRSLAARAGDDLDGWLTELQLGEADSANPDDTERVLLTTIHRSKGGEWRVVFVTGLEEGILPHHRALAVASIAGTTVADERRVAYVAVTRPRDRLYVTYCRTRRRGEQAEPRRPSRFLRGLPLDRIEPAA